MTEAESPLERRRRLARERQRRRRQRLKAGKCIARIECDDAELGFALADDGLIDGFRDDDPEEIARGLRRLVERWLDGKRDVA